MKKNLAQSASVVPPTQTEISQRASMLWENQGRPDGRDQEIWLEAERQLLGVDPLVEGRNNTSMLAVSFDETTAAEKPRSRLEKQPAASTRKTETASSRSRRQ